MRHLHNGIYCRGKTFNYAIGTSRQATHLARRLIAGVFKPEVIATCTWTGQAPRAQGKGRQSEAVVPLFHKGKSAIIGKQIILKYN